MKIVFYGRHQVGQFLLLHLLASGHQVRVVTPEDALIQQICDYYDLEIVKLENLETFDLFLCCHGKRIIPAKYLSPTKFINFHPCLRRYKGQDPIARYIKHKDILASVSSHFMVEEVDAGEELYTIFFKTPVVKSREEFYMYALPHYLECLEETMKYITVLVKTYV